MVMDTEVCGCCGTLLDCWGDCPTCEPLSNYYDDHYDWNNHDYTYGDDNDGLLW